MRTVLDYTELRDRMVARQIEARGVRFPRVLAAMRAVRREAFVPDNYRHYAYDDMALPIAADQTISQPFVVALMAEALGLEGGERVLEVGTGSGYAAAVLAELAAEVFTVEWFEDLARTAERRLREEGYADVEVRVGDGSLGWPQHAPFDGIVVSAGAPSVPPALREQLAPGGRLVIPVGRRLDDQRLVRLTRLADGRFGEEDLGGVRFVPLVGQQGWGRSGRS
jgi:protein-L-isoaspartate(D-aspartate) O-methyltransferase